MNLRFTDAARHSMINANRIAERYRHQDIGSLHILIACFETRPAFLDGLSIDYDKLREAASELFLTIASAGGADAMKNALKLAVQFNSTVVDAPHVFLGVLTEPNECTARLFELTNLDLNKVRTHIRNHLSQR